MILAVKERGRAEWDKSSKLGRTLFHKSILEICSQTVNKREKFEIIEIYQEILVSKDTCSLEEKL